MFRSRRYQIAECSVAQILQRNEHTKFKTNAFTRLDIECYKRTLTWHAS